MSSSSNYRSSHLRRVNIQPNGKRPFEECGYDSDPEPSLNNAAQASGSGNPGSSRHFTSNSSSNNGSGEGRNKRARSTSSSSTSDHSSSSDVSTSTGYDTAQSSSHSDLSSSGLSAMPRNAVDCPVVPTSAPIPQQREVSDAPIQLPRPAFAANRPTEMSASVEDTLRTSLERFNEFDRQIAALRSSLGSSSPQLASSEHAPPHEEWHAMSASFLSMNSSGLRTSDTTDESSHVPPNGAVSSFPTFGPSNPAPVGRPPVSSANSSTPFPPFGGIHRVSPYSAYRPPAAGRSSAGHENSGATLPSSSAAPSMASTSADVGMRQSSSDPVQSLPPSPQLRPVRRSPSPLSLDPLASSNSDGIGMLRNRDYGSDPQPSVSHISTDNVFFDNSRSFVTQQETPATSSESFEARNRVIRQHSVERGPTRSVFDVFGIGDSLPERNVAGRGRSPVRERTEVSARIPSSTMDTTAREPEHRHLSARAPAMGTFPTRPGFHSRLYSVPSSTNSLMSENAMEHRHMTARDQIWNPFPRNNSSFDVADHANDESPSSSLMNSPPRSGGSSRSEILLIPNRGESARNAEHASSNGATATGPGLATIRRPENVPEPESVIVRPPPDMIDTTFNFPMDVGPVPASPISLRDESRVESRSHSFEWMPPYTAPQRQQSQASVSTSYSYSSLNLDSFQAGMFRDTLQRSAEVRRPPPTFGRVSWGMGDDSDSSDDMDLEILRPVRQPSPFSPDRYRAYSTTTRPQRGGAMWPDRTEPIPSNANNDPMPRQSMPRGPMGSVSFNRQNVTGGMQSSRTSVPSGPRVNRTFPPVAMHMDQRRRATSTVDSRSSARPTVSQARPENATADEEPAGRRLFPRVLQRLANLPRSSDSTRSASSSQPNSRSPPQPAGARPVFPAHRRMTLPDAIGDDDASPMGGMPFTPRPTSDAPRRESVPWRSLIPGLRSSEAPDTSSGPSNLSRREPAPSTTTEERPHGLRSLRQRAQLNRGDGPTPRRPGGWRSMGSRRIFPVGDYVPDELFDSSYEALLSLSSVIGEARSRATPEEVIASLENATYREWAREDSETRCPICLDDYEPSDIVAKLLECPHWLHKHCLEQWLRTANTCPVCRKKVKTSPSPRRGCQPPRGRSVTTPVTSNESGVQSSSATYSRGPPSSNQANVVIPPSPAFPQGNSTRAMVAPQQQLQPARAVRPVSTQVEISPPIFSRHTGAHEDSDRTVYPTPLVVAQSYAPHTHFHLARARPPHSQPPGTTHLEHPPPFSYRQREPFESLRDRRPGPAAEQLIIPPTPVDQNLDNRIRHALPMPAFDVDGNRPRSDIGVRPPISEVAPNSFMVTSSPYPGPVGNLSAGSRSDTSSTITANTPQNPLVAMNRPSVGYPYASNFSVDPISSSHRPFRNVPSELVVPPLPLVDGMRLRGQETSGHWPARPSSTFLQDNPSGGDNSWRPW